MGKLVINGLGDQGEIMSEFIEIIDEVQKAIDKQPGLLFRGHNKEDWKLLPSVGRVKYTCFNKVEDFESSLYFDFVTRAGSLLNEGGDSWNVAFSMQHHGLPTRLLDWTEAFSTALYFALEGAKSNCAVWLLNPFQLNLNSFESERIYSPSNLRGDYSEYFLVNEKKLEGKVVAISPLRHHPRVFSQKSGFTLHEDLVNPLEILFPEAVKKITIPKNAQKDARRFLRLSLINEFTLFPDLDGLARELKREYEIKYIS